jgi:hypothetical protein
VPLQFFHPPLWLSSAPFEALCYGYRYKAYLEHFDGFLAILRAREREIYGNELLADEWDKRKEQSGFVVAHSLEHWTAMDWFANRYINLRVYGGKQDLPDRVAAFMQSDPARKALAKQKALDWASYKAELEEELDSTSTVHADHQVTATSQPGQEHLTSRSSEQYFGWLYDSFIMSPPRYALGGVFILLAAASSYIMVKRGVLRYFSG